MRNQLKAGAILSYLALFISSAISIVYTPIMLKLLGQSEYGIYSLATSAASYVGILNFGLGNAVIRYTAKYKALNDEQQCSRLYGMFFIMYGLLGSIALISGTILTLNAEQIFSRSLSIEELTTLKYLMAIMVINIAIGIGFGIFSVIILALEKFVIQKVIVIISSIISPLIVLPLLIMGYGSIAMAVVTTAVSMLSIIFNMFYCFKVLKIKIVFGRIPKGLLREIIVFSSFIFLNLIIERIYWSTDQIILGIYSGSIAVSIYSIGTAFSGYFIGFSSAISNVFLTKVTGMVTREVPDKELSDLFIKVGRVQFIILSFAMSGFIVFGQPFIHLWVGSDYNTSYLIALIILVPSLISLIQSMGGVILQAKNLQKFKTILYFCIAVANVILSIIFVQYWGAVGCAIATAIAFIIGNVIIMNIYYQQKLKIEIKKFWINIMKMSLPLSGSILFAVFTKKYLLVSSWGQLLFECLLFSIVYFLVAWFLSMNEYEKQLIKAPIGKVYRKIMKSLQLGVEG
ncbi:oligosaccharide flippase family protein [Paenibacillus sp. GXUN7292]|uniref:oligosaccharide flippase family protein n=1 Tax=Paenibacillus sp. GXUN7292 TaxID=3422499 RepID=UPI003D7DB1C2